MPPLENSIGFKPDTCMGYVGSNNIVPRLLPCFLSHTVQKMLQKAGEEPGNEAR